MGWENGDSLSNQLGESPLTSRGLEAPVFKHGEEKPRALARPLRGSRFLSERLAKPLSSGCPSEVMCASTNLSDGLACNTLARTPSACLMLHRRGWGWRDAPQRTYFVSKIVRTRLIVSRLSVRTESGQVRACERRAEATPAHMPPPEGVGYLTILVLP